jgi:hypothetical protein
MIIPIKKSTFIYPFGTIAISVLLFYQAYILFNDYLLKNLSLVQNVLHWKIILGIASMFIFALGSAVFSIFGFINIISTKYGKYGIITNEEGVQINTVSFPVFIYWKDVKDITYSNENIDGKKRENAMYIEYSDITYIWGFKPISVLRIFTGIKKDRIRISELFAFKESINDLYNQIMREWQKYIVKVGL